MGGEFLRHGKRLGSANKTAENGKVLPANMNFGIQVLADFNGFDCGKVLPGKANSWLFLHFWSEYQLV